MMPKPWLPHWHAAEERKGLIKALMGCTSRADWPGIVEQWGKKERCTDLLCTCEAAKKKRAGSDAGTSFHTLIESYLTGGDYAALQVNQGEARAFKRFLGWARKHTIKPLMLEQHIVHPIWKYCGTFDGLCEVDSVATLVDWKTSNSMDPAFKLQIAAYGQAAVDTGLIGEMPRGLILRLDKREKPYERAVDEEWIAPDDMKRNFEVFTCLRRPYHFALLNRMLSVGG